VLGVERRTASSQKSMPGTIQASITDVSGSLAQSPGAVLQATSLLQQSCAARFGGGKTSSLVVGGRDGLSLEPGGFIPSPLYRLESLSAQPSTIQGLERKDINSLWQATAKPLFSTICHARSRNEIEKSEVRNQWSESKIGVENPPAASCPVRCIGWLISRARGLSRRVSSRKHVVSLPIFWHPGN